MGSHIVNFCVIIPDDNKQTFKVYNSQFSNVSTLAQIDKRWNTNTIKPERGGTKTPK